MRPTLTRRGYAVLGFALLGLALGWGFGGRSLNAVVMPAFALLAGTGVYALWFDQPRVTRDAPAYGHQGETHRIELQVAANAYTAVVEDHIDDGLRGNPRHETIVDDRQLAYEVDFTQRGIHTLGPCRIVATDPLGLWTRTFQVGSTHDVTVYPKVHDLEETATLLADYVGITDDRERFDGVREYARGDPLRDVNWKASAKRPRQLVVTEFAGEGASDQVQVAVESLSGRTDSTAAAAASVVTHLLDAGVSVGLLTPHEEIDPAHGDPHRHRIFATLAEFGEGRLPQERREMATLLVRAPASGEHVEIVVDGESRRYAEVLGTTQGATA